MYAPVSVVVSVRESVCGGLTQLRSTSPSADPVLRHSATARSRSPSLLSSPHPLLCGPLRFKPFHVSVFLFVNKRVNDKVRFPRGACPSLSLYALLNMSPSSQIKRRGICWVDVTVDVDSRLGSALMMAYTPRLPFDRPTRHVTMLHDHRPSEAFVPLSVSPTSCAAQARRCSECSLKHNAAPAYPAFSALGIATQRQMIRERLGLECLPLLPELEVGPDQTRHIRGSGVERITVRRKCCKREYHTIRRREVAVDGDQDPVCLQVRSTPAQSRSTGTPHRIMMSSVCVWTPFRDLTRNATVEKPTVGILVVTCPCVVSCVSLGFCGRSKYRQSWSDSDDLRRHLAGPGPGAQRMWPRPGGGQRPGPERCPCSVSVNAVAARLHGLRGLLGLTPSPRPCSSAAPSHGVTATPAQRSEH